MGKLEGKVAIVTGAGQGMGSAIAHSLAQQGASVVVNDMNETTAEATVSDIKSYNPKVISYVGNVTDICDVQQMIEHTESHLDTSMCWSITLEYYGPHLCFRYLKRNGITWSKGI